jgi:hypothetical protein
MTCPTNYVRIATGKDKGRSRTLILRHARIVERHHVGLHAAQLALTGQRVLSGGVAYDRDVLAGKSVRAREPTGVADQHGAILTASDQGTCNSRWQTQ